MSRKLSRRVLLGASASALALSGAHADVGFAPFAPMEWVFTGGPISALNAGSLAAGSGYTPGSYPNTPLLGSVSAATDAQATIVVGAGGTVSSVTLTLGGAIINMQSGAVGYYLIDTLTAPSLAGGSGFSIGITSVTSYSFTPRGISGLIAGGVGGGGAGGGGQSGGSGAGGGGGGAGASLQDFPLQIAMVGATLTLTPGQPGAAAAAGASGGNGTASTIAGQLDPTGTLPVSGGSGGSPGSAGTGGTGGAGGSPGQGAGGAAGAIGTVSVTSLNPHYLGGAGGGGGGNTAGNAGQGGDPNVGPFGGNSAGTGFGAGGGGAKSLWGDGGRGGNGAPTPSAGATPANFGGGGGGGGTGFASGAGAPGKIVLRAA